MSIIGVIPQTRSDATFALYNDDAVKFVRQFTRESERDDLVDLAQTDCIVAATKWFLNGHGRWSQAHIRRVAAALGQQIEQLGQCELIALSQARALLDGLKNARPQSKRQRRRSAKSIKLADLRRLIGFFRDQGDHLNVWIAGYLQIASRLGWRPGEMFSVWIKDNYLCAFAEKHTNERSLCDICKIGLHAYPRRLIEKLAAWIAETGELANERGGRWKFRDLVKKRIVRACDKLGIRPVSLYTLRHVAIASMKKCGLTPEQIAVIVNHAATRTATERYGKARTGTRRAKKLFRIEPALLARVRKTARRHGRKKTPTPN